MCNWLVIREPTGRSDPTPSRKALIRNRRLIIAHSHSSWKVVAGISVETVLVVLDRLHEDEFEVRGDRLPGRTIRIGSLGTDCVIWTSISTEAGTKIAPAVTFLF
jgi:hypothetical protein